MKEPWEGGLRVSGKPRPSGGDPLPPDGVPRALCPGEGAVLPAVAPWPTAGHPSAWEFLELGPAGAGRAQELREEWDFLLSMMGSQGGLKKLGTGLRL